MDAALLDTDTLNEVLKQKNANAIWHAAEYLAQHRRIATDARFPRFLGRNPKALNRPTHKSAMIS